jgi:hypothetical protein
MTAKATTRDSDALATAINNRDAFVTGGALSGEYNESRNCYVVRSYSEPIAVVFYSEHRAVVTTRKWSTTTSRHQGVARRALAKVGAVDNVGETGLRIDGMGETY